MFYRQQPYPFPKAKMLIKIKSRVNAAQVSATQTLPVHRFKVPSLLAGLNGSSLGEEASCCVWKLQLAAVK